MGDWKDHWPDVERLKRPRETGYPVLVVLGCFPFDRTDRLDRAFGRTNSTCTCTRPSN